MHRILVTFMGALLLAMLLAGCGSQAEYTARFVSYGKLQDGSRIALVQPVSNPGETQQAYVEIEDLKAGELVRVEGTGRSWDTPQWMPERSVVGRAKDQ